MTRHTIVRTPAVEDDLIDIWLHVAADNPGAADGLLDRITERIGMLADFPEAGIARRDIALELRMLPVGNYVVLYRIAGPRVEIARVVHGARDTTALF